MPGLDEITGRTCEVFQAYRYSILAGRPGVTENNVPRWVAMYLRSDIGGYKIRRVADYFTEEKVGRMLHTIGKLNAHMEEDKK